MGSNYACIGQAIALIRLIKAKSPENAATVGRYHQSDECDSSLAERGSFIDRAEPIF
jgi:hypothetical protein